MMDLDEAVELVLYAFKQGKQGDLFVQKSPATTIGILADAVLNVTKSKTGKEYIGTRHGDPNGFLRNDCTDLKELEIPCLSFFGRNIPIGGGGFFRLYPFFLYKILVRKYLSKHDSFVFFLHPYEINYHKFEGIKRMKMKDKFRFDFGRKNAQKKFWKLIRYLKKQGFTFNNPSFYLSKRDFEQ